MRGVIPNCFFASYTIRHPSASSPLSSKSVLSISGVSTRILTSCFIFATRSCLIFSSKRFDPVAASFGLLGSIMKGWLNTSVLIYDLLSSKYAMSLFLSSSSEISASKPLSVAVALTVTTYGSLVAKAAPNLHASE
mgnify:CR=1 FL=1